MKQVRVCTNQTLIAEPERLKPFINIKNDDLFNNFTQEEERCFIFSSFKAFSFAENLQMR